MAALLVLLAQAPAAVADDQPAAGPPAVTPARLRANPGGSRQDLTVKFREGTAVRLRGGRFTAGAGQDLSGLEGVLGRLPGSTLRRLFSRPEEDLRREKRDIEARSGRAQADLNLYYRVRLGEGTDPDAALASINALPIVEVAYAAQEPAPPPASPTLVGEQGYRAAAPSGVDADFAVAVPGARGQGVKVIDIEYAWNQDHEDLSKARLPGALIANGTPRNPFATDDHGTAVLGVLTGDENAFGVTGVASDAAIGLTNASTTTGYNLADAIDVARSALVPGDVILIEQQAYGPRGCSQFGCVPVEWVLENYDAIVRATAAGIIVVEAAGNGSQDLDEALYGPSFPLGRADSGAIVVGAGKAPGCNTPERGRLSFSNYGKRLDVQAWGECVVTAGYGSRSNTGGRNALYANGFGGTSSASAIVAGVAASVSSAAKAIERTLTSSQVRSLLQLTGTFQQTAPLESGRIGPLPNLRSAVKAATATSDPAPPELVASLPPTMATVGTAYQYTFAAIGSPAPTYAVTAGALPAGMSLDGGTGRLSGTPTATGSSTFTITATNGLLPDAASTSTVAVSPAVAAPELTAYSPPTTATVGIPYDYALAATGTPVPTFTVTAGSLPHGLSLDRLTGRLAGTPSSSGTFTFTIEARNGVAPVPGRPAAVAVSVVVRAAPGAPVLTASTPPATATVGIAYDYAFAATGTPAPSFAVTAGALPAGLGLDGATGRLSGVPTTAGASTFTVTAANGVLPAAGASTGITVSPAPAPAELTAASPPATAVVGVAYGYTFTASGYPAPTFAVSSGALPAGLSLDAATGQLAGTPTVSGTSTFVVTAANGLAPTARSTVRSTITVSPGPSPPSGYWMAAAGGGVFPFGDARYFGNGPSGTVDLEPTPSRSGYWVVAGNGTVTPRGDARYLGDRPPLLAGEAVSSLSATPDGSGYWLFTSRGRVFAYGTAPHLGGLGAFTLNAAVLDSTATPSGRGYYMVASDGGIFAFGDARFAGSTGGLPLNAPVVSLAPDPDGKGYWLVASDGGVFAFDAPFVGSLGGTRLNRPISAMVASGRGYLMVGEDGGVFAFGPGTRFRGSLGASPPPTPVVAVAAV